jgi:head-tail adaptor
MKPYSIGARGRRFVLEVPLESPDGFGGVIRTYAAGPQVWGAIEMLKGDERIRAGRPEQAVTHRATWSLQGATTACSRSCLARSFHSNDLYRMFSRASLCLTGPHGGPPQ